MQEDAMRLQRQEWEGSTEQDRRSLRKRARPGASSWRWAWLAFAMALGLGARAEADTKVFFTKPVDRRYAWLGNDAQGSVDFKAQILSLINGATSRIEIATFSFGGVPEIGAALATKAQAGQSVRVVVNRGQRLGDGLLRALRGPVQVVDNNLPALHARVSFQQPGSTAPVGWLADTGALYAAHGAFTYGWTSDASGDMKASTDASYTSPLLGHHYARSNNLGPRTWEIQVPNGHYYVHAVVGEADYNSKNFLYVEGQPIFRLNGAGGPFWGEWLGGAAGEFKGAVVEGGQEDGFPNSRRIQVSDGKLSITLGKSGEASWSSLAYVEIYRASAVSSDGDHFGDKTLVQEDGIQHAKFLLVDAGTPSAQLWTGSGNLSAGMYYLSEDALLTDNPALAAAFQRQFDQMWGAAAGAPNPAAAAFTRFKSNPIASTTIASPRLGGPGFLWHVLFSPSVGALDMAGRLQALIDGSQRNVLFVMEQFTSGGSEFGLHSAGHLLNNVLLPKVNTQPSFILLGAIGNEMPTDPIFTTFAGKPNAHVVQVPTVSGTYGIHDKVALFDALGDSRFARRGKVLFGAMNWSKGGMLYNDEQTLVVEDPALANQFLQRAMKALADAGVAPPHQADVVLVLDRSYSMNRLCSDGVTKMVDASKMAAKLFIDILDKDAGHRASVIRFGETVEPFSPPVTLQPLTGASAGSLKGAIDTIVADLPIGNWTCYGAALGEAQAQLAAATPALPRRLIHFFTDGLENKAPMASTVYPAPAAAGVEIHSTAFGPFSPYPPGTTTAVLADMASASAGSFEQVDNDALDLQKRFVEVARDAMRLDTLLDPRFELLRGRPAQATVVLDKTVRRVVLVAAWGRTTVDAAVATLETPWGQVLTPTTPGVRQTSLPGSVVWHVDLKALGHAAGKGPAGTWKVALASGPRLKDRSVRADLSVLADTDIDLRAELVPLRERRGRYTLLARLLDQGEPVVGGRMTANWRRPGRGLGKEQRLVLLDDGRHGDGRPRDGLFGAQVDLEAAGSHRLHVIATAPSVGRQPSHRREAWVAFTPPLLKPAPKQPDLDRQTIERQPQP
jgi:phosphatidylserine/phosphatidylglycerophosphate/cardiolipin synthase-like enzyme